MRNRNRRMAAALLTVLLLLLSGCMDSLKGSKVVLTTGFEKNEVFRIEDMSCTLPEAMVYLINTKNRYESVYGREIWNVSLDGVTLEENIKETVLAQLAQQKTMNLLARQNGVALSEEEEARVMQAAETYFQSLSEEEKSALQITVKDVEELYREYALARKVYQYIIKDINPEISDDEARTITVQYIYFRTCVLDGTGRKIEYSEEEKQEILRKAEEVRFQLKNEEADFEELILKYSDSEEGTCSFGKGEKDQAFEDAAFNLETDEISDIVETPDGYYLIKCISTFNRTETDANKVKIVEKRREEVFGQEYEDFVAALTRNLNEDLWQSVSLAGTENITTSDFFDVFDKYFDGIL